MTKYNLPFRKGFNFPRKIRFKGLAGKVFWSGFVLLFASSLVIYLFQVNTIAAKGFHVRELEKQISQVKENNEKLKLQVVEMRSMTDLSERVENLQMVEVDKITYYDTAGQVVARK